MPVVRELIKVMDGKVTPVMLSTIRGAMHFGIIEGVDPKIVTMRKQDGKLVYIVRECIESGFIPDP